MGSHALNQQPCSPVKAWVGVLSLESTSLSCQGSLFRSSKHSGSVVLAVKSQPLAPPRLYRPARAIVVAPPEPTCLDRSPTQFVPGKAENASSRSRICSQSTPSSTMPGVVVGVGGEGAG